jgi:AraC-like DNA-binding protein
LDFRESWISELPHPFHTFHVYIPQGVFDSIAEELRSPQVSVLTCPNTRETLDPTMYGLAASLMPLLASPQEANALFVDHMFDAIAVHLAFKYGGVKPKAALPAGGLKLWQQRRVNELMLDDLRADISISELAAACGLSTRHFQRSFRRTTGLLAHKWRIKQRVKRAKELLQFTHHPVSEIALTCGFCDQAHFARVFSKSVGHSPRDYRRLRCL